MSPPATSVECRVSMSYEERPQTVNSSHCRYSSGNSVNSSASNFNLGETASSSGNTGEGYGFKSGCSFSGLGQNSSSRPLRSKPRLAKVRRGFGGRSSNSISSFNVDSGFNPFLPGSSSSDKPEDDRARARQSPVGAEKSFSQSGQSENAGFVFGANIGLAGKRSDRRETKFEGTGDDSENVCNVRGAGVFGSNHEPREHAGAAKNSGPGEKQWVYDGSSVSDSSSGIEGFRNRVENEERVELGNDGEDMKSDVKGFVYGTGFPDSTNRKMKFTAFNRNRRGGSRRSKIRDKHNLRVNLKENGNQGFVFGSGGTNLTSSFFSDMKVPDDIANQPLNKGFIFSAGKPATCGISVGKREGPVPKTHPGVNISDQMKNLNINNKEKGVQADKVDLSDKKASTGENDVFVFRGFKEETDASNSKPSAPQESMYNSNVDGEVSKSGISDGYEFGFASENIYASGTSKMTFGCSDGEDDLKLPNQLNGSNNSVGVGGQGTSNSSSFRNTCSQEGLEKERSTNLKSFSFVANMNDGFNRKGVRGVKSKLHRNTKSTKAKRKAMPKNPQPNLDSTECYSPMDFSPSGVYPTTEEHSAESRPTAFEEKPLFSACPEISSRCDGYSAPPLANSQEMPYHSSSRPDTSSGDAGVSSNSGHPDFNGTSFQFSSDVGNRTEKFKFTASTSPQGQQSSIKRQQKRYRMKTGHVSSGVSSGVGSSLGNTPVFENFKVANGHTSTSKGRDKKKSVADQQEASFSYMSAVEKSCDKWRMRGNEAYKNGELSKAEGFYTWGINCVPPSEEAKASSLQPLVLCYSNRAATKMALGRVREALKDCLIAVSLDPQFLKGQIRAANCHLLLGELDDAKEKFEKCLQSGGAICLDRQFVLSASDGLQKAQKVTDHINHAVELLKCGTSEAAIKTLDLIDQGLSLSLYSEKLLECKAQALLMLQRYDEAIGMCHQTLGFANKNFPNHVNVTAWRDHILAKCYFYQGKFDAALELLDKQESKLGESLGVLASTIHDLIKHKNAGNEAFQAGKHGEAIEHYTSAILRSTGSRPFAAVCLGNRAAAYQSLGLIADAIADCSLAIALDENYAKAISRRATLHEMIRDYKQAASDLERLVSILENNSRERTKESRSRNDKELRQTTTRLSSIELEAKREIPLDMYRILGVKLSDTEADIKKAYRKAALKHHPDKAAQSLGRGENDDGRLWMEIADSVRKDSDRLFKMIGEAYAVLSDPEKRSEYDLREEYRSTPRVSKSGRSASSRRHHSDVYSFYGGCEASHSSYERSNSSRRYWW